MAGKPANAAPAGDAMVIYIQADDCAPCRMFNSLDWPQWQALPGSRAIHFVRTTAPRTTQAFQSRYWPAEARPYLNLVKVPIVPSFILVAQGSALVVGNGLNGWRNHVLPQARRLIDTGPPSS